MWRLAESLLRVGGSGGPLSAVLLRGTDVDERVAEVREHVFLVRADGRVVPLHHRVLRGGTVRRLAGQLAALRDPAITAAVEEADVLVTEEGEDPQRVRRPPVVLVAVDHDRVVAGDALAAQQLGEALAVDVVPHDRVVELRVPVHLHRSGNVARLVEEHVLVRLDDHEAGLSQVGGEPLGRHQAAGLGVLGELGEEESNSMAMGSP